MDGDERILERVLQLEGVVRSVEAQLKSYATQLHVAEALKPIEQSMLKQESIVNTLSLRVNTVFDMHEQLLQQRAKQEREEFEARIRAKEAAAEEKLRALEEKTLLGRVRKYGPILGWILAGAALFGAIYKGLESWIRNVR